MAKRIRAGKNGTFVGDVEGDFGDNCTVVGATDGKGNTILKHPMAIGHGALAGPGTVAVGAGANAGSNVFHLIRLLRDRADTCSDEALISVLDALHEEFASGTPDRSKLVTLWLAVQTSATLAGASQFVHQLGGLLGIN